MHRTKAALTLTIAAAATAALALGPLNPPAGAPADTSPSLGQVLGAVNSLSGSGGDRQASVPGVDASTGSIEFDSFGPVPLIGLEINFDRPGNPGGPTGSPSLEVEIALVAGTLGTRATGPLLTGALVPDAVIRVPDSSGGTAQMLTLVDVVVTISSTSLTERGDMTYAPVERFVLTARSVKIDDAAGSVTFNF